MTTEPLCTICDGTGWAPVEADGERRVGRCDCWRQSMSEKLLRNANVRRRYEHCDFKNFITYQNERLLDAVKRARRFAEAFPVVERGMFFVGPPGIGKSHLAVAILKKVINTRGAKGLFYDVRELLRLIRSTYDPVARTAETDIIQPVINTDLLVLDDIGAEKTSEWVEETLNLIVNSRYSEKRPTIFTSNYEEKEDPADPDSLFVRVGYRMHSRLYEMCEFVEFDGADYRHREPNSGPEDLLALWKNQRRPKKLPSRFSRQARFGLGGRSPELRWPGGRAGRD